ncbi:hypothetical protein TNCV_3679481 [Trichonephila clavipes]|nr:hypothetical protein TNCV_3679481 [Trichonephila clavipes]
MLHSLHLMTPNGVLVNVLSLMEIDNSTTGLSLPIIDLMHHLVALGAAAPSVYPGIDMVASTAEVAAPVQLEFSGHQLRSRGAVSAK